MDIKEIIKKASEKKEAGATRKFNIPDNAKEVSQKLSATYINQVIAVKNGRIKDTNKLLDMINKYTNWLINAPKKSLLIKGTVGNGKTTLATSLFKVVKSYQNNKDYKKTCYTVTADNYIKIGTDETFAETFAINTQVGYANCDILFLDDLGATNETLKVYGNETSPIADLLVHRYNNLKPTIITTNLSIEEITKRYGERIADRLTEMCDIVTISGNSYRQLINLKK